MYPVLLPVEVPFPGRRGRLESEPGRKGGRGVGEQRRPGKVEKVEDQGARVEASVKGQGQCLEVDT